jgi:hypothetical protein
MDIAGLNGIQSCAPMSFLTIWFLREREEALFSVAIMGHVLRSMVKSEAKNDMEGDFLRTSSGGSSLCGDVELAW